MRKAVAAMFGGVVWVTAVCFAMSGSAWAAESEGESAAAAESANAQPAKEQPTAGAKDDHWIGGRFDADFDGAWSSNESDIDLDQTLQLNIDPTPYKNVHVRSMFWVREDVDSDNDRNNTLRDLDDNYGADVDARIVYLYMDVDDLWGDSTLRIGRQRLLEGPSFNRFDGLFFKQRHPRWDWYVFGGWQASLYSDSFDDPVAGGGAAFQLSAKTRVALDLYWEEDSADYYDHFIRPRLTNLLYRNYPRDIDDEREETRVSLSIWQTITPNFTLFGRLDLYSEQGDELTLQATGYITPLKVTFQATYRRLMGDVDDSPSDLTGYYRILGPQQQYDDFQLVLHRALTEKLGLTLEGQIHRVDDHYPDPIFKSYSHDYDYADRANRDFNRVAVILSATDLIWGLSASSSLQVWDVEGRGAMWSIGGDVSKEWEAWSLTLGANYERYENEYSVYNPFPFWQNSIRRAFASLVNSPTVGVYYSSNFTVRLRDVVPVETNDDIYSVFAKLRWRFCENQNVSVAVSYEEDDSSESPYWRVRAGYTLEF